MLIIWHSALPDKATMLSLETAWPDQHSYITSNLMYYLVSICVWSVAFLASFYRAEIGAGLMVPCSVWYIYVIIWNLTCYEVVHNSKWHAADKGKE